MKTVCTLGFLLLLASSPLAQTTQTIEGYWQDIAGRTTFKRNAPPAAVYGGWQERDREATYPQAKLIRKSEAGFELTDLNYDERDYSVQVLKSDPSRITFVRKANWSECRTEHDCRIDGNELYCSMRTLCREKGEELLDWTGDERYVRRAYCERDGRVQLQGFPVKCR